MANPTTNFGWVMPTSTSLVTNLPADFNTFGQAVDTSMSELLGGTTGQVLSKTSNTNMDFTWINNDQGDITAVTAGTGISGGGTSGAVTVTNSMATAIDAKGDLIAGTAADTFSRLAVGTDYKILTADSAEATGMKWTGDWISYTPTWTAATTNPVLGNGSLTGGYRRIGQQVDFWADLTIGPTTTTGSGAWRITLPVSATSAQFNFSYDVWILDSGVTWFKGYVGEGVDTGFADKFEIWNPTFTTRVSSVSPMVWAVNDGARITGSYRVG